MISTITATQVYKGVSPVIRKKYDTSIYSQIKELWRFRTYRRRDVSDLR